MDYHVTSYLVDVKSIVPYLYETDNLIGYDVEDKDIERMITCVNKKLLEPPLMLIKPATDIIGHQESQ